MLDHPVHHRSPFPFFVAAPALGAEDCIALERSFSRSDGWQRRDAGFYRCFLRDVTAEIPPRLQRAVVARMRDVTGLPLRDEVQITAQRLEPGDAIGRHSDRPLAGFEIARLVVQLSPGWRPEHGGVLQLHASPDGEPVRRVEPEHDTAFGFVLHEGSHHSVSEARRTRRSVVFNFWHAANPPELEGLLDDLFAGMDFGQLPRSLDSLIARAERELGEDATFHAGAAAWALHRWGCDEAWVRAGYRHAAGLGPASGPSGEARAATRLADWVAGLRRNAFDLERWQALRDELAGSPSLARRTPLWRLCVGEGSPALRMFRSLP